MTLNNCIAIPQSATYELQDRIFVYKVIDGKASATEIHVTPQNNGKEYIVTSGLEVGDIIVAEGAGLIKEGTPIKSRSEQESKTEEGAE
jgi:membrane fusion protein (multidrug efflux system)